MERYIGMDFAVERLTGRNRPTVIDLSQFLSRAAALR